MFWKICKKRRIEKESIEKERIFLGKMKENKTLCKQKNILFLAKTQKKKKGKNTGR